MLSQQKWPIYSHEEINAVTQVLESGKVNYWTGEQGKLFEREYAEYLGLPFAITVANGTNALELCLHALGIGPGDEVIVPLRTFMASASCVVEVGATPVMCDVDMVSQNLTVETVRPHVNAKTKAIIAVHLGGWPCEMEALMAFAEAHHLYVIEDCAQAHGAFIDGKPVGSFGHLSAFSFCQDKMISTMGEGGLFATGNEDWFKKAWAYKDHGKGYDTVYKKQHPPGFRWLHDGFGSNYRMTEAQAAVGRIQLRNLPEWTQTRRAYAKIYDKALQGIAAVRLTLPPAEIEHGYYRYYCFVQPHNLKEGWSRDRIIAEINALGVWCQVGSCSEIYLEEAFVTSGLAPKDRFQNAKELGENSLAFLIDPHYTASSIHEAASAVAALLRSASRME